MVSEGCGGYLAEVRKAACRAVAPEASAEALAEARAEACAEAFVEAYAQLPHPRDHVSTPLKVGETPCVPDSCVSFAH